jgi:hypothetical protein
MSIMSGRKVFSVLHTCFAMQDAKDAWSALSPSSGQCSVVPNTNLYNTETHHLHNLLITLVINMGDSNSR